jgi:hypothetical protein
MNFIHEMITQNRIHVKCFIYFVILLKFPWVFFQPMFNVKVNQCKGWFRPTNSLLLWLVGARGRRPLWSPPWVPVTFGHCFLFFLIFYSLFFTALDALPCPALPLPCPCPCPALFRISLLLPGTGGGSYTGNGQCFFFLLLPGTGGGSYTGNFFSFCCQGQEEEVTQRTGSVFFSFCC